MAVIDVTNFIIRILRHRLAIDWARYQATAASFRFPV